MLADRQAELLSEIRQLSRGITVGRMAPPGTPSKEGGKETLQEKARRTQSAPPATKPKDQYDKEKSRQQRASVEKELLPDVKKVKQRTPYSEQEEREMIDYFLKYGGFLCKGGNLVWKRMEESKCVPRRSWQSLKERFNKYTCQKLHLFGVKKRDLIEGGSSFEKRTSLAPIPAPAQRVDSPARKRKRGPPYSTEEERSMVKYFLNHTGKYAQRRGNLVWKEMETARICPGRSWASLKQRFSSFVQNNLEAFGVFEGTFMGVAELQLTKDTSPANETATDRTEEDAINREGNQSESKFRKPYSAEEEREVVDYLLTKGGLSRVGGNQLWKEMEEEGVCSGRSWQSLKARFAKAIIGRLQDFGTSREALETADSKLHSKKNTTQKEKSFIDEGEDSVPVDEILANELQPEDSPEVDTQKLITTIFGDDNELDIGLNREANKDGAPSEQEVEVDPNKDDEPSELELLSMELAENNKTNPNNTPSEKDEFDTDSDSDGNDSLMNRIIAKSKRKRQGQRGKRGKQQERSEENELSVKERSTMLEKKRKAETQEVQDSPPKKRLRVS